MNLKEAYDYSVSGCAECRMPNRDTYTSPNAYINFAAALEMVLYNGKMKKYGDVIVGLETGNFEDLEVHHFFNQFISDIWKELITSQNPYSIKLSRTGKQNFLDSILVYFHYHFTDFREPKSLEIIKEIF